MEIIAFFSPDSLWLTSKVAAGREMLIWRTLQWKLSDWSLLLSICLKCRDNLLWTRRIGRVRLSSEQWSRKTKLNQEQFVSIEIKSNLKTTEKANEIRKEMKNKTQEKKLNTQIRLYFWLYLDSCWVDIFGSISMP